MSNRVKWIDAAKGLGALYVIIGHFILNGKISVLLYAFHMPLFFFLAGITFNIKENETFFIYLKKKFVSIIIPYFIFSVPLFLFNCVRIIHNGSDALVLLLKKIIGIILCWKTTDYYNGVWFLPCIFTAYLISYAIISNLKSKTTIVIFSILSLLLGLFLDKFDISLPFGADTALIAAYFMCTAYVIKELIGKLKWICVALYIPMGLITFLNYTMSGKRVEMYSNDYGNYVLFILASLCGIIATIGLANISSVTNNSLLNILGKESMYMYGSQLIFFSVMNVILPKTGIYSLGSIIQTAIGLAISGIITFILLKMKPLYYFVLNKFVKR